MIPYLDDLNTITIVTSNKEPQILELEIINDDKELKIKKTIYKNNMYIVHLYDQVNIHAYTTVCINQVAHPLVMGQYTQSVEFDETYATYKEMGVIFNNNQTIFRIFAPTVIEARIVLNGSSYLMKKIGGYFEFIKDENCHGQMYSYIVSHNDVTHLIIDPYAQALTENSRRSYVIDFDQLNDNFHPHDYTDIKNESAIIYEVNVRDATSHYDSGVETTLKSTFLGLVSDSKNSNSLNTGLNYFQSLGVTHLQLMPVNDFVTVDEVNVKRMYNWGYDPNYFMSLEGSYSTLPHDPFRRIIEFRQLIKKIHESNMNVILDNVLNHVYDVKDSSFQKLVPEYYFRHFNGLELSNGTGVGNDFATEKKMARKFILDTIKFWLDKYYIDGFRFDLMGSIDIETMLSIETLTQKYDRHILLLGEGWDLNTNLIDEHKTLIKNLPNHSKIHFFNDHFRDLIKGSNFDMRDKGYINGEGRHRKYINELFMGNLWEFKPSNTVNYVEVHDNHTLYDRLKYISNIDERTIILQHQIGTAFTLLSFGLPFLHAGQEFFRTKFGHGNSYNLSDLVNQMDWKRMNYFQDNISYVKDLIAFRKCHSIYKLKNIDIIKSKVTFHNTNHLFYASVNDDEEPFTIIINPTKARSCAPLYNGKKYSVKLSNQRINDSATYSQNILIKPYEVLILI